MQLDYQHLPEYQFPHWIDHTTTPANDDITTFMDINEWCGGQFGELGDQWGYERKNVEAPYPQGLNPVRVRLHYTSIVYSWRFKNKSDAMAFKLAWGGS